MDCRKPALIAAIAAAVAAPHLLFMLQPYFADEYAILLNAVRFLSERTLVPFHVSYPTLYSYLALPFIAAGLPLDVLSGETSRLQTYLVSLYVLRPLEMALPARFLSVCFLAVSAATAYRMVSIRKGALAGSAAALILLLSPSLLDYGSYALPDIAVLAFSMLSFAQLLKFIERNPDEGAVKNLLWASAAAGLAISCKYNALSTVIPIAAAVLVLKVRRRLELHWLNKAALCCVLAFLAGSPGWLLAPQHLASGLAFEFQHAADGHLGSSGVPILGQLELLATNTLVMLLTGVAGACVWWQRRTDDGWLALSAILGSLVLSAFSSKQSLHYLYPGFAGWLYFTGILTAAAAGAARRTTIGVLVAAATLLYGNALFKGAGFLSPNTTQQAESWIYRNIPPRERIAVDWLYVPYLYSDIRFDDLRRFFGHSADPVIEEIVRTKNVYDVLNVKYDLSWLTDTEASYVVTSEQVFARFFCTGLFTRRVPAAAEPLREKFDRRKRFYEALFRSEVWQLVRIFETGNGPRTYLFARKANAMGGVTAEAPIAPSLPGCE